MTINCQQKQKWAWFTVLSVIIYNISALPTMVFFAFILKGLSDELNLSVFQNAVIITYNVAISLILATIIQPLFKYNYIGKRQSGIIGAILTIFSFITISYATQFYQIVLLFSILLGFGMKLVMLASYESMYSYFPNRKQFVNKISVISIGAGSVIMAPVMAYLLVQFESRMTIRIMGYVSVSLLLATVLLKSVEDFDDSANECNLEMKMVNNNIQFKQDLEINKDECKSFLQNQTNVIIQSNLKPTDTSESKKIFIKHQPYCELLSNKRYLCVSIGIILNTVAESVFSALLPFMLYQFKFNPMDIGIGIAFFATSMIFMKYVALYCRPDRDISARVVSILSIIVLIGARVGISLGFMSNFRNLLIAAVSIGSAKGFLQGYIDDVTGEVISSDFSCYAEQIQNITSALFLLFVGPLLGYFRDLTGTFQMTMTYINAMNSGVIIIWTLELLISVIFQLCRQSQIE